MVIHKTSSEHHRFIFKFVSNIKNDFAFNNKLLKTYADKYNRNKKQCNYDYCLRYNEGYTYGDAYWEFLADLLSYDSNNFRVNSELRSLNSQLHTLYMNTYNKNKDKFRQVKESYK